MRLVYLGSPYHSTEERIRRQRVKKVQEALAYFANNTDNLCIYSPISHWSGVADSHELPHDFRFWLQQDFHMIRVSTALWILTIDGWKESYGLEQEMEFAESISKPIVYVEETDTGFVLRDKI